MHWEVHAHQPRHPPGAEFESVQVGSSYEARRPAKLGARVPNLIGTHHLLVVGSQIRIQDLAEASTTAASEPRPANWFTAMSEKRKTEGNEEALQSRGDCRDAAADGCPALLEHDDVASRGSRPEGRDRSFQVRRLRNIHAAIGSVITAMTISGHRSPTRTPSPTPSR